MIHSERPRLPVFAAALVVWCASGCGRTTQVDVPNRRLLESLKTAVMAKNGEWLKQNEKAIDSRRAEGKLSDQEYEAFQAVLRDAKGGDWTAAANKVQDLAEGQHWSP